MCLYNISQSNQNGDNKVEILNLEIDVEWVRNIIFNDRDKIKAILNNFKNNNLSQTNYKIMKDIEDKNRKNELVEFYEKFIKKYENEMDVLYNFFKEEEMFEEIDEASESIKIAIYSIQKSEKLTPKIFGVILSRYTQSMQSNEDKKLMKLFIFFLYRHCFIGEVWNI